MAFKIQAFILVLTLSISFSYSIGVAPAGSPSELGRRALEGSSEEAAKESMINDVKELLPKYEEFLHSLKDRIGMITEIDTAAQECIIHSCLTTFETEYSDLQKLVEVMSSSEEEFQPSVDKQELQRCNDCLVEMAKEDRKIERVVDNFRTELDTAEKDINTYNS